MGSCCSDGASSTNNTIIVSGLNQRIYALNSSDMPKYDDIMKYCQNLKNLSHTNIKPLTSYNHNNNQLVMNSTLLEGKQQNNNYYISIIQQIAFNNQLDIDLYKYMDQRKNSILPSSNAKHIIRQICSGLQYLHSQDIIHGELNLKNIEINPANNEIVISKYHFYIHLFMHYFFVNEKYSTISMKFMLFLFIILFKINLFLQLIVNMSLPQTFQLKLTKNQSVMREFESPEKQKDETLTKESDLYSLGVIGLTLYGISFSSNLKLSKPVHCPLGLYDKLKDLTNQSSQSRPPLSEVVDALDLETNPGSYNNLESQDKKSIQSNSDIKKGEQIHQVNIKPQIVSQQQQNPVPEKKSQQEQSNKYQDNSKSNSNSATNKQDVKLQPKSEVIYRKSQEKIEYDFNPFSIKKDKDINYVNPMKKIAYFQDHEAQITSIITDKNGQYVYTSSSDGSVIVYQFNEKQKQLTQHIKLNDFQYGVSQVILTSDNNYLIAADLGSNIYIYTTKDHKLHKKISNLFEKSCILSIDISQDNKELLVSATYKNTVLCTLNNFEISKKQNIQGQSSDANVCRFFQNNIIIGESSGKVLVYSKDNLITPVKELSHHTHTITQISVNNDVFAVSSQDKNISIFDKSYTKLQTINSHVDCVSNISIKDTHLTSNGWDGSTCLYLKDSKGQYELKSCFPNETSWSVSSIYFQQSKLLLSIGGRFLFIFA